MKILFVARSKNHFSYYSSLIYSLLEKNHTVLYVYDHRWSLGTDDTCLREFMASHPELIVKAHRYNYHGLLNYTKRLVREILTLNWYGSNHHQSSYYYNRWIKALPKPFNILVKRTPILECLIKRKFTAKLLQPLESILPIDSSAKKIVKSFNPNVVIASPANMRHASEVDFLRYSNRNSTPTYCLVLSWDNLTTKGLFHEKPKKLICWNKDHFNEARKYHGFSSKDIFIAGSLFFDKWHPLNINKYNVSTSLATPLIPGTTYILWLGSSSNIVPDESSLVNKFSEYISIFSNNKIKVIFRPHPSNQTPCKSLGCLVINNNQNVTLPDSKQAKATFYQLLAGSICTIGINTSAMIDSLILLKPSIAFVSKEYQGTQTNSLHFQSLAKYATLLQASSLEKAALLAIELSSLESAHNELKEFRATFAFPHGISVTVGDTISQFIITKENM